MLERLSVPRRPFDFEDYVDILRRNIRWIIAPAFAGIVIATVAAYLMTDTYVSQSVIRIVPQQISPVLVQPVTSQDVSDEINTMAQTILSRQTLSNLINTYGLYKNELRGEPLDDIVAKMQKAIRILPANNFTTISSGSVPAIQVSFSYKNPILAQRVCADLVSQFMNLSNENSLNKNRNTNVFIGDEVDNAKRNLDALEQKLADFRTKNAGRLPDETQMNISQMNALENRLGSLTEQATRNNEQRMMLETQLHAAQQRLASIKDLTPEHQAQNDRLNALDSQIATLEMNITNMQDRYKEAYPDLQSARQQLVVLQNERKKVASQKVPKVENSPQSAALDRERLNEEAAVAQIETSLKANAIDQKQINKQIAKVNADLGIYQSRLEGVPAGEKEYTDLLRDRDLAKQRYEDLELKRQKSNISMDMERRKQGETLELLDQASLPASPSAPKRGLIIPMGFVGGLFLGLVLVAVREVKDTSLKNLKDARLYTQLSILGSIPLLENDLVVQRRKQLLWVGWATATLFGLAVIGASMAHYYLGKA